jgi:hypothetical protein
MPENLRVYKERGEPARLVSVTAFPLGAEVRVTNVNMEELRIWGATASIQDRLDRSTVHQGKIPGTADASGTGVYRIDVIFAGKDRASRTTRMTKYFRLPSSENSFSAKEIELTDEPRRY